MPDPREEADGAQPQENRRAVGPHAHGERDDGDAAGDGRPPERRVERGAERLRRPARGHRPHRLPHRGERHQPEVAQEQGEAVEVRPVGEPDALDLEGDDSPGRRGDCRQRHYVGAVGEDPSGLHVRPAALAREHRDPERREANEAGGDVRQDEGVEQQGRDGHDGSSFRWSGSLPEAVSARGSDASRRSIAASVSSHQATFDPTE